VGGGGTGAGEGDAGDGVMVAAGGVGKQTTTITDQTDTNLITFRRTIYLTIMSSLDFEE
jgi:hypothetical protein